MRYLGPMHRRIGFLLVITGLCLGAADAPPVLHLRSSLPSPQPVGTSIGLLPEIDVANPGMPGQGGMMVYQYSVSVNGSPFHIIRDFSQQPLFAWTPELVEQKAAIRIVVRNNKTKDTMQADLPFEIVPRVKGKGPMVSPTSHPLVALFSAPPCPAGSQFRVAFHAEGEDPVMRTSAQPCRAPLTNNVLVGGMRAETKYQMREEVSSAGSVKSGAWLPFQTGMLDGNFLPVTIVVSRAAGASDAEPFLIYSAIGTAGGIRGFATDLQGRMVWYLRSSDWITRVLPGGRFLNLGDAANSVNSTKEQQVVREVDLAGNILRETNAGRVAEQLDRFGIHSDCRKGGKECVSGFHHEAIRLPNGHTLVVGGYERMMPAGTQGAKEAVDILGDVVVDLDEDFQVTAVWNSFDHLDIKRKSLQDAKCHTGGGGCPAVLLADEANGWLHSNSLNYIPSTGDFLVSMPEQDWVLKVDWKNGKGSGKVLWHLGNEGDFKAIAKDPNPWFSFQHDANYEPAGSDTVTIVDDVFALKGKNDKAGVRAQTWKLDEEKHTATLVYNAETGEHTICCGSMQALKNGGYSTSVGWILPMKGRTAETDKDGKVVFAVDVPGAITYRSFRVADMYSPPNR
jgi:arylsulfate sulfotransferase